MEKLFCVSICTSIGSEAAVPFLQILKDKAISLFLGKPPQATGYVVLHGAKDHFIILCVDNDTPK